jgi:hypothetical protein
MTSFSSSLSSVLATPNTAEPLRSKTLDIDIDIDIDIDKATVASPSPLIGYYINLDSRPDRRTLFEKEIKRYPLFAQLERLPATKHTTGAIGCTISHCHALLKLQEQIVAAKKTRKAGDSKNIPAYVAVFEDDFCVLNNTYMQDFLQAFERIRELADWDVITLTPRGETQHHSTAPAMATAGFLRIHKTQTMTGYIVKTSVLPSLIQNQQEAIQRLLHGKSIATSICDQYWKRLQSTYKFYYYKSIFAGQRPGWSNLENKTVDYNARFLAQNKF